MPQLFRHFVAPFLASALAAHPSAPSLNASARQAILEQLDQALKTRYVFPGLVAPISRALAAKAAAGGFDRLSEPRAFAAALASDLRTFGEDRHFNVFVDPEFRPQTLAEEDRPPTPDEVAGTRQEGARAAFGLSKVERLPGNVAYLEIRGFWPTDIAAPDIDAAFTLLSGADALILDLRRNRGGEPETVAYFLSHVFSEGDPRHLNDVYDRPRDTTRQYWTSAVSSPRFTGPIYVLLSAETFSGGEECAYDLQTQKRGTLVGETTGGGANPGSLAAIGHGLVVFIPSGKSINPITHTNWEHVGVKPDLPMPAAGAFKGAYVKILEDRLAQEKDAETRKELQGALARARGEDGDPGRP